MFKFCHLSQWWAFFFSNPARFITSACLTSFYLKQLLRLSLASGHWWFWRIRSGYSVESCLFGFVCLLRIGFKWCITSGGICGNLVSVACIPPGGLRSYSNPGVSAGGAWSRWCRQVHSLPSRSVISRPSRASWGGVSILFPRTPSPPMIVASFDDCGQNWLLPHWLL